MNLIETVKFDLFFLLYLPIILAHHFFEIFFHIILFTVEHLLHFSCELFYFIIL